jgi:hypothetical protein
MEKTKIVFDFRRLEGRIVEKFGTRAAFAAHLGMKPSILSARLNGVTHFRMDEILTICGPDCLAIDDQDVMAFFFTPKA